MSRASVDRSADPSHEARSREISFDPSADPSHDDRSCEIRSDQSAGQSGKEVDHRPAAYHRVTGAEVKEMDDQQAIERYRYMLRTAPPDDIERAHAEAFAQLTPEQRAAVLNELSRQVPASEAATSDDPQSLARMATRAEMRQPGTIERTFAGVQGPGLGGMFLSTLAGAFVGTAIADAFFDNDIGATEAAETDAGAGDGDIGGGDFGGGDIGDFGGGDFGDFGV
jgi:hypothetical protein